MKSENEIKDQIRAYMKLYRRLDAKGGPEADGDLFEEMLFAEENILAEFGLTQTADNQKLIQSFCKSSNEDTSIDTLINLLKIKAQGEEGENRSPLEILYLGIINDEEADNVLPRMGFNNHIYNIYLYYLARENMKEIIEIYNEMCRAKDYLEEISLLKHDFDKLQHKNIRFLKGFLLSDLSEVL